MTTHGIPHQVGDEVMVDIGGWAIPGVVVSMTPFRIRVNMSGCVQNIEPAQLTASSGSQ